ncbi:50S ribosomal protein L22 [Candidatus Saccharibacteria bacterium]|nr:50S ribosomal protein L22 [Candidatus Saccharibacteria bacterium]
MAKVKAVTKFVRISPQKMRLVADLVRGKSVEQAFDILFSVDKKASGIILKNLKSAVSNAEHNHGMLRANLVLSEVRVDGGPKIKRYRPRARGMSNAIRRPTSHLSIALDLPKLAKANQANKAKETKNV